jgi:hypothetical protein
MLIFFFEQTCLDIIYNLAKLKKIMNKVKSLELKRLLKELEFIELDFEYRNEVISEADTEFINSINSFLIEHPDLKEIYDNKITDKINESIKKKEEESIDESIEIEDLDENVEDKKYNSKIKKLYREIVKVTHPDIIKNNKLNDLYIKATNYYDESNPIGIYAICNELDIPYEITNDDVEVIMSQIEGYKSKIKFLESTYTWKWYNCEDEMEKNQILINYIKLKIR